MSNPERIIPEISVETINSVDVANDDNRAVVMGNFMNEQPALLRFAKHVSGEDDDKLVHLCTGMSFMYECLKRQMEKDSYHQ